MPQIPGRQFGPNKGQNAHGNNLGATGAGAGVAFAQPPPPPLPPPVPHEVIGEFIDKPMDHINVGTDRPSAGKTVVEQPPYGTSAGLGDYIINVSTAADDILPWGYGGASRDMQLRKFWPTEPIFASALYSTVARYVAYGWDLKGPTRIVRQCERLLHGAEHGQGWVSFATKLLIDLFTQDNGAFIETARAENKATSPVVGLNVLDANRCIRTGRWDEPVLYYDQYNRGHIMKWWNVVSLTEFPSPIEYYRGMQYCALTRLLRAAQIARDISIYKKEKISGQFTRGIWLVGGIQAKTITDAVARHQQNTAAEGLTRYIQPVVVASLDPTATVSAQKLDLATLPDGFDEDKAMRWYVAQLALAFGADYQDFAPLPGGNLGSSAQSRTLHQKSRGKGPRLFMTILEHLFNYHGVFPSNVSFKFGDQDLQEDMEHTEIDLIRAQERAQRIASGEITPDVARLIAVDAGDLDPKYIPLLNPDSGSIDEVDESDSSAEEPPK